MEPHALRAPADDGGLLADPPLARAGATLADNISRLAGWDHDFQGRRASFLRPHVRSRVLELARAYLDRAGLRSPSSLDPSAPLIVTGHQPELFHPGVWIKNFAVDAIARRARGVGLNLIVDNDLPKASALKVPRIDESNPRMLRIPFDEWPGEIPYEDLEVADEGLFGSFGDRVKDGLAGVVPDPVVDEFWPRALEARAVTRNVGLRFAAARRSVEAAWGVDNLEVPLSAICESEGFLWFASHILAHLPRFQEVHNAALRQYRRLYHIRSTHHPVPALGAQGEWLEAPFWIWRATAPRRRPLLVRQLATTMQIRIGGESEVLAEFKLGPDREACCAVEELSQLPEQGVRLRTRALTTTMFARYLLGDLFLHGIGGAKYDELGDEVSRRFFGFAPPRYMTLSLTLWLGRESDPGARERAKSADREVRDLLYNPDRHVDAAALSSDLARWADLKRDAIAGPVDTNAQRLERFQTIRRCNEALQAAVAARREALIEGQTDRRLAVRRDELSRSREYSLVLHSRERLRTAFGRALEVLEQD